MEVDDMSRRLRRGAGQGHRRFFGCAYRMTVPRQIIVDVLHNTAKHLSAEEVYFAVHKIHPAIGLTTVYRNLELLVQGGVVSKFDFGDGRARYEFVRGQNKAEHHHHLVCKGCGRVINYTDFIEEEVELLKKTEKGLAKKYNFDITDHLIQFYGFCEKCKNINKAQTYGTK